MLQPFYPSNRDLVWVDKFICEECIEFFLSLSHSIIPRFIGVWNHGRVSRKEYLMYGVLYIIIGCAYALPTLVKNNPSIQLLPFLYIIGLLLLLPSYNKDKLNAFVVQLSYRRR